MINNPIIYKFFKGVTNHRKKTHRAVVFSCGTFPNVLKYRVPQWSLPTIWKTRLLQTLEEFSKYVRKFRLAVLQNHHWNRTRTRYLWQIKDRYDLFNHLKSYRNIMQFQISSTKENSKEIPESSQLEFLEKFSANNIALSDAEDNTSAPLNKRFIADLILLRTLMAICQKSCKPGFWEVMDLFVLLAYASLAA